MSPVAGRPARIALWVSIALFVAVCVTVLLTADGDVPAHVSADGSVNRWESPAVFIGIIGGIGLGVGILFLVLPLLVARVPAWMINLPNAQAHAYWTAPENRPAFERLLVADTDAIGAATLLLIAWCTGATGLAAGDVGPWVIAVPTAIYLVVVLVICMRMAIGPRYRPHD